MPSPRFGRLDQAADDQAPRQGPETPFAGSDTLNGRVCPGGTYTRMPSDLLLGARCVCRLPPEPAHAVRQAEPVCPEFPAQAPGPSRTKAEWLLLLAWALITGS